MDSTSRGVMIILFNSVWEEGGGNSGRTAFES